VHSFRPGDTHGRPASASSTATIVLQPIQTGPGHGIGLSVAKRVATHSCAAMSGSPAMRLRGTTFFAANPSLRAEEVYVMNQPVIRILVVDDESAIRRALAATARELGFQVVEASRGEEALLTLRARSAFDVVLLDHQYARHRRHGNAAPDSRLCSPAADSDVLTVRDQEEDNGGRRSIWARTIMSPSHSARGRLIARIRTAVRRVRAPIRAEDAPIEIGRDSPGTRVKRTPCIKRGA